MYFRFTVTPELDDQIRRILKLIRYREIMKDEISRLVEKNYTLVEDYYYDEFGLFMIEGGREYFNTVNKRFGKRKNALEALIEYPDKLNSPVLITEDEKWLFRLNDLENELQNDLPIIEEGLKKIAAKIDGIKAQQSAKKNYWKRFVRWCMGRTFP